MVDFIDFARSEGRFAKHFDKDGNPSETLLRAKQDRLENWHLLQELAGVRGGKPAAKAAAAKNPLPPGEGRVRGELESGAPLTPTLSPGEREFGCGKERK